MITKRQLKRMLQSLTERVERLEAKAELFDKGLEVCVDAHKESLRQIGEMKGYSKADKPAAQTALKKESDLFSDDLAKEAHSWAGSDAVEAYKAGVKRGADLFSEPAEEDVWIDSKEARELLGWQTISTSMLKAAGIRYQQPQGKYHKITAHKGDIENYIANRR